MVGRETDELNTETVLVYDGDCGLCSRAVQFVLRADKKAMFKFAAFGSAFAEQHDLKIDNNSDAVVLYHSGRLYYAAEAALKTLELLGGIYSLSVLLCVFPKKLRAAAYAFIAKRRKRFFRGQCLVPNAKAQARFLK